MILNFLPTINQWVNYVSIFTIHAGGQDFYPYSTRRLYFYSGDGVGDLRCVSISIYDDTRVESDVEYFYFSVSSGPRAIVSQSERRIRINIRDNDGILRDNCFLRFIP